MKEIIIKTTLLVALPIILAATTVFCAVFGICMAADRGGEDAGKPVQTPEDDPKNDGATDTGSNTNPGGDENGDEGGEGTGNEDGNDNPDGNENEGEGGEDDPKPKKYVAFTFDDGPAYQSGLTKNFVDELTKYGGEATLFLVGNRIHASTADNVIYAVEHGWELGIHAYTHKYSFGSSCSDDLYNSEVQKTADAIHKYLPEYDIKLLRPPGGTMTSERIKASPYSIILWNVDSRDWEYTEYAGGSVEENVQTIVQQVLSTVKDGSIVLMHEIYNNSYLAFCEILKALDEEGYEFVTVSELLGDKLEAGKIFYSGK